MAVNALKPGLIANYRSFADGHRFFSRDATAGATYPNRSRVECGLLVRPQKGRVIRLEDVFISGRVGTLDASASEVYGGAAGTGESTSVANVRLCQIEELAKFTATGGSTTSITCTALDGKYADSLWVGKYVLVQRSGAKLRIDKITAMVGATFSLTLASGTAVASGDVVYVYGLPGGTVKPLTQMFRSILSSATAGGDKALHVQLRDLGIELPAGFGIAYYNLCGLNVVGAQDFYPYTSLSVAVAGRIIGKGARGDGQHNFEP